jgi:hypothetical protein
MLEIAEADRVEVLVLVDNVVEYASGLIKLKPGSEEKS